MRIGVPLVVTGLVVTLYGTWPYASLLKLQHDLRRHDVQALQGDIDWPSVRSSLNQEILGNPEGKPVATPVSAITDRDDLPAFGASFAAKMARNAVDRQATPQRLADEFGAPSPVAGEAAQPTIESARFDGLTHFVVELRTAQESPRELPLRLNLALVRRGWTVGWQVTQVRLPACMLQPNGTRARVTDVSYQVSEAHRADNR